MYFRILNHEATGKLTYLLAEMAAREAVLIDPLGTDLPVLQALLSERDLSLRWVLRTHHHDQFLAAERGLLAGLGAPVIQGDELASAAPHGLAGDMLLHFGSERIRVIPTPGHTLTCLSYAWRDRFFCGGLLAMTACAHQRHPQCPEALWDSVTQRVFTLPDETLLFSGNEQRARAVSTVMEQRRWHPFLAGLTRDEFLAQMAALSQRRELEATSI